MTTLGLDRRALAAWLATALTAALWLGLLGSQHFFWAPMETDRVGLTVEYLAFGLFAMALLASFSFWLRVELSKESLGLLFAFSLGVDLILNSLDTWSAGVAWILDLALACAALGGGALLALKVERFGQVGVMAVTMSLVDLWSVYLPGGWTGQQVALAEAGERSLLDYFLILLPYPLADDWWPCLGVVDMLFAVFFMAISQRFSRPRWRVYVAVVLGIGLSMAIAVMTTRPVPALPLIAMTYVAAERDTFRMERRERKTVAVFMVALLITLAALSWMRR